jgi:hypothetical protein
LAIRRVQARQESLRELAEYDPAITQPQLPKYSQAGNPVDAGERERGRLGPSVTEQLRMSADKFWVYLRLAVEAQGVSVYLEDFPVEDCRGVSLFVDGFPAILLSANERRASWKSFSLMHEFAHILIREPGISDQNARVLLSGTVISSPPHSFSRRTQLRACLLFREKRAASILLNLRKRLID